MCIFQEIFYARVDVLARREQHPHAVDASTSRRSEAAGLVATRGVLHFADQLLDDVLQKEHPGGLALGGERPRKVRA